MLQFAQKSSPLANSGNISLNKECKHLFNSGSDLLQTCNQEAGTKRRFWDKIFKFRVHTYVWYEEEAHLSPDIHHYYIHRSLWSEKLHKWSFLIWKRKNKRMRKFSGAHSAHLNPFRPKNSIQISSHSDTGRVWRKVKV